MGAKTICWLLLYLFISVQCGYPPTGDEVVPGSVLLPATRRGRYLANIVRRQAVDGTGIKFNKDADRMNAEAKKKVDVLSEELLPYIIAEQDRRVTLHSRIMTAIQNGEKGITIVEMRNKSPLLIRKGNMYRCPPNRAPVEPDGSGTMMCEDNIQPTQIIYDSCLSAEDRPLYYVTVSSMNKFFFCDRQRVEGADLPHTNNGTVVACHPTVRTSLNYTMDKCALEDTDDVVVHFRYYPDRTYKYVTELDPDREMCDHWNPCQIGYIFSLPQMDQAKKAEEFYPNEYDETVDPVPEDNMDEGIHPSLKSYRASPRKIAVPPGYTYVGVRFRDNNGQWKKLSASHVDLRTERTYALREGAPNYVWFVVSFDKWRPYYYGQYFAVYKKGKKERLIPFLNLVQSVTHVVSKVVEVIASQKRNTTRVPFVCNHCQNTGVIIRSEDDQVYNLNLSRYRVEEQGRPGKSQQQFVVDLSNVGSHEIGYYYAKMKNGDGFEERVRILEVQGGDDDGEVEVNRLSLDLDVGGHFDRSLNYNCESCRATEVLCNGESATAAGRVFINPSKHELNFNFPSFQDDNACVYVGFFRMSRNNMLFKILAVVDTVKIVDKPIIRPPKNGEMFQMVVTFSCHSCKVQKVFVNGLEIEREPKLSHLESGIASFETTSSTITIRIAEFGPAYLGVYQAVFDSKGERITKTIMQVEDPTSTPTDATPDFSTNPETSTSSTSGHSTELTGSDLTTLKSTASEETTDSEGATASEETTASADSTTMPNPP